MRLLLIEDDRTIGSAVRDHLMADGHAVDWATDLADGVLFSEVATYALILLDLQLPDGNGIAFLQNLRRRGDTTPIVILTARDQISHRIAGLNAGADDYMIKPFDLGELSARIHAVARRVGNNAAPSIMIGDVEIIPAQRFVQRGGVEIELTAREWAVLDCLLRRSTSIISKAQIEEALYEFGAEIGSNAVEVYVSRLRKKLGRGIVATVRGLGYRIVS